MFITSTILLALSALFFGFVFTKMLVMVLPKLAVMDNPNERSNHDTPTPRGGGIAIVLSVLGFLLVAGVRMELVFAVLIVAVVSFLDDVKGVAPAKRLGMHLACGLLAASLLEGNVFQGFLPFWADKLLVAVVWAWFMNIYNFMDGIDEITSTQTFSLCAGVFLLCLSTTLLPKFLIVDAVIIGSGTLGFWWFNRHPAKIFLGDIGSITLGFVTGYLLLHMAERGFWMAALILPAYYVVDAGLTMTLRLLSGKKIWEAHSEHAYQVAVRAYKNPRKVVTQIAALNMLLIVLAVVSAVMIPAYQIAALEAAYLITFLFWLHLRGAKRTPTAEIIPPMAQAA